MKEKVPNEILDAQIEAKTVPLNRKARRALKHRREAIRALMAQGHQKAWTHTQTAQGVWDQERTRK
jgi:hypothetical protein